MRAIKYIIILCIVFLLIGCTNEESVYINVEDTSDLHNTKFGESALIEINDNLWYDSTTLIVYFYNGCVLNSYAAISPSPYYAPNGLPYKYDPTTNTFFEITNEEETTN